MYQPRVYRQNVTLESTNIKYYQSDIQVYASHLIKSDFISQLHQMHQVILKQGNNFINSLTPIEMKPWDHPLIRQMKKAAIKAGVGPMAAVAGTISQELSKHYTQKNQPIMIENGGDLYIHNDEDTIVNVFTGNKKIKDSINIKIKKEQLPLAVCTSSGKIGHSLSFGNSDAVVVLAKEAALADAFATKIGNQIKTEDDIKQALNDVSQIKEIHGVIIVINNSIGIRGDIELC